MDTKLDISGKVGKESPTSTYKPIPEADLEEEAVANRPKSLVKVKLNSESDGADEKMLPEGDNKIGVVAVSGDCEKASPKEKQNGDAKLDIVMEPHEIENAECCSATECSTVNKNEGDIKTAFVGMTKEELMKYANDPFWVRLRWFLFIGFWVLWAAMLVGAVVIIYVAPKCDPPPPRTWWQLGPLARLPPGSNLDDLTLDKNIKGLIVSYPADIYKDIKLENIANIISKAKEIGTKIILEIEPSGSDLFFEKSEAKHENYTDYYVWQPPKYISGGNLATSFPNNWLNPNSSSSWKCSEKRKECYYVPFGKPHLNFRNDLVKKEFAGALEKLLDLGASGISLRNAAFLLVDERFEDEQTNPRATGLVHTQYGFYLHTKTENLPELAGLLREFKKALRSKTEDATLMVSEELNDVEAYKVNGSLVVDLPLESHVFSKKDISVNDLVNTLNYVLNISNVEWPLWKANTTAVPGDALDIVTYLLPGTPLVDINATVDPHLLKIREESPSILRGNCSVHGIANNTVLAYTRETPGSPGILVALNPTNDTVTVNFPKEIPSLSLIQEVTVQTHSKGYNETDFSDLNAKKDATAIPISPKSAIVLSYVPKSSS